MGFIRTMGMGAVLAALAIAGAPAYAADALATCGAVTAQHARTLADEARRVGNHRKAAECYRLAGDPVAADRALSKAFIESNEAASREASATIDGARAQARRIREAFRPRRS
jgi:hypothetical protein